jgi:soluble lytic murein transglycosylase-like protein
MQLNEIQDITDSLALMPDPALQQYAQMHKDDPYVMSLAMSESNRRKKLRAAQQGQAGQMPQPKVVDQAIAAMNAPPPQQMPPQQAAPQAGPPQGQGIAQLPTPNLQGMADGGIAGYDDEENVQGMARGGNAGSDPKAAYRQYALSQAAKLGLDPSLVDSIFKIESGYNADAQSPTGPVGIGQLTKQTGKAYGAAGEDRKDPYKNIDASLAYMADLKGKYGNDPAKIAVAYNQGEPVLNKHLRQNNGEINQAKLPSEAQSYLKKLSTMLTAAVPIGSAQAAPVGQATPGQRVENGYVVDQFGIPLYKAGETPNTTLAKDERGIFERGADYLGIPQEFQRNASNTLNALGGYSAPAAGITKLVGGATPEAVAAAGAAAQKANTLRIAPPVAEGIAALAPEAQATRLAADTARRTRLLTEDQKAAQAAADAVKTANAPRIAEEATVAQRTQDALRTNQGVDAARAGALANAEAQTAAGSGAGEYEEPGMGAGSQANRDALMHMEREQQNAAGAKDTKDIIAAAKETADPEVSKGWTNDDWLTFGLSALASNSPRFLQGIGEAGLATQKQRQARTQQESTQELTKAQIKKLNADTDYLNEQKGQNALRMKALSLASADFEKWMTTAGLASTPEEQEAARKRITGYYMQQMGVIPATMGGTGIAGFKFLGAES